jgi:hypothetical protein
MDISVVVHEALRRLKVGDTGIVSCGKFPAEDVRQYVEAYALHKDKWFALTYDRTLNSWRAVREFEPPWRVVKDDDFEEE